MFGSFQRSFVPLLGFAAVICLSVPAAAIQQPSHLRGRAELELAGNAAAVRTARAGTWTKPRSGASGRAFARLEAELGVGLEARFDDDTGVLDTLIPAGYLVPGANRDPAIAERFAREFLARHLELLAPGSSLADFTLVSDTSLDGVRSVGFVQTHAGLAVVDGQLSLRFKHDQLIAARSQALPHVQLQGGPSAADQRVDPSHADTRARAWLAQDFAHGRIDAVRVTTPVSSRAPSILPLVRAGGVEYREVVTAELELVDAPGRWTVYLDAQTGEPIARRSQLRFAELEYTVWRRSPQTDRVGFPGAFVEATIDNQPTVSSSAGELALPITGASVGFGTDGLYVRVFDDAGPLSSVATPLMQNQVFVWDLGSEPERDAQVNGYVHAQRAKDYVRTVAPELGVLDLETRVTVNIDDVCNAYADGNTINFYLAGGGCENTALVADIIYHEYGHVTHTESVIPGVGLFDGAHSEGASDYLSATMVDDPSVGRGFFVGSEEPIRELDPEGYEWRWPEDTGEVHDEGRIIGGTLWDLREVLIAKYGVAEGVAKTDLIWIDGLRRAVDIPSTYLEALITNDDDGNLANGTPDVCEINEVFAAHGLYEPPGAETTVTSELQPDGSVEVVLAYGQPFAGCPNVIDPSGLLRYRARGEDGQPAGPTTELAMAPAGPGLFESVIPPQPDLTVTQFQVELDWGNGTVATRPDNFADPWYESFNGDADVIWCEGFEDPALAGWSLGGQFGAGAPEGGSGDPDAAYEGAGVLGVALEWPGLYAPGSVSTATSPTIDASGYEVVRLQYRRWLNVEDGYFDRASIRANGETVWQNYASPTEQADTHHRDREWRFHDVVVTDALAPDGTVELEFDLGSDGGLELGGWNIDQLCVVGHGVTEAGFCGDGIVQGFEQCDDGNAVNGDGCSTGCLLDDFGADDTGDEDSGETGDPSADDEFFLQPDGRGCGCTTEETRPRDALGLLGFGLLLLGLRRRRDRLTE